MGFRSADIKEKIRLVSLLDPAIDHERTDAESYTRTGDLSYVALRPNAEPTYFVCRQLTKRELARLNDKATSYVIRQGGEAIGNLKLQERNIEAFRIAVQAIENYEGPPIVRDASGKVSERWLDAFPSFEAIQEIGLQIVELSQLGELDEKK